MTKYLVAHSHSLQRKGRQKFGSGVYCEKGARIRGPYYGLRRTVKSLFKLLPAIVIVII